MFDSPLSASAYEVLGVDPAADEEALRRAYPAAPAPDAPRHRRRRRGVRPGAARVGARRHRRTPARPTTAATGSARQPAPEWSGWRRRPAPRRHPSAGALVRAARRVAPRALPRPHPRVGGPRRHARGPLRPGAGALGPTHLRRLLADALAEEATARVVSDLGHGLHRVARRGRAGARRNRRRQARPHRAQPERPVRRPVRGLRRTGAASAAASSSGDGVPGAPVADLLARIRLIARAAGVRFGGVDRRPARRRPRAEPIDRARQGARHPRGPRLAQCAVDVLRRGSPARASIGGNEVFDVRTRLQQAVRFA